MLRKEYIIKFKTADIVLFGAGQYARDLYRDYADIINITYCISNNPGESAFVVDDREICPVYRVDEGLRNAKNNTYIICASASSNMMEEQLWCMGYIPGQDFCSSEIFRLIISEKKIAVSYGVCYMRAIHDCLAKSRIFSGEYEIFYSLSYMKRSAYEDFLLKFLVGICDLYIYNSVLSPNERMKQEELLSHLSEKAIKISIPTIISNAFYPQSGVQGSGDNPYGIVSSKTFWGTFTGADYNINSMLGTGRSTDDILEIISRPDYYDHVWLNENWKREIVSVKIAESLADINISDYIIENKGRKRLFIDANHISEEVILEISGRILSKLGIQDDVPREELSRIQLINASEVPIYPSVIDGLELSVYHGNPEYRLFLFNREKRVTFEEYVRLYCDFCGNMMRYMDMGYFPDT